MRVLSARGLSIGWGGRLEKVLASGIDLDVAGGELTVLVGPNGSGKSTLLRTLVGLQPSLGGSILLDGRAVGRLGVEERSRMVASVFTERGDPGYFTVFDVVAFGRYPYTDARGSLEGRDLEAVRKALAATGLDGLEARPFAELSDGERQKALVARAIAQDCPLLVLDEPTAFLDAPARSEIFRIVLELTRTSGTAVLLSTHDVDHALGFADRLWIMDRKHRFRSGTPEDLVMEGSVGRAFDGGGSRFDPARGIFLSDRSASTMTVEILGPAGAAKTWVERLAERLGLIVALRDADGAAERSGETLIGRIRIELGEGGPTFVLEDSKGNAGKVEAGSYEELAKALKELMAARRERS